MNDLRATTNSYWLLRQFKNRTTKEFTFRRMGPFWDEWLSAHIHGIGKAIMRARALEITKENAA